MKDSLRIAFNEIVKLKESNNETEIKFWIIAVISILVIIIPFIQTYFKNKNNKLDKIIDDIEKSKIELEELYSKDTIDSILLNAKIERILSKYDDACFNFYKCKVPRQTFKTKLNAEIINMVNKYKNKHEGGLTAFQNSAKYYKQHFQQQ
jgi:hypothetical protein